MQKPTEKEIKKALNLLVNSGIWNDNFQAGFGAGVNWLLNWQKSQELQSRCHCGEIEIEPHTCPYKVDVGNNSETLCRCCSVCRKNCADEI